MKIEVAPDRTVEICLELSVKFDAMPANMKELGDLLKTGLLGKLPVSRNEEIDVCDTVSLPMAIITFILQLNFSFHQF